MTQFYEQVKERMIRYAEIDTQSDSHSQKTPTTRKQFDLAVMLEKELNDIGAAEVYLDRDACVVYACLPANVAADSFGLIAHMDTAPDAPGANVKPWVLEHYDGKDIVLNAEKQIVMSPEDFPNLKHYIGQDLILTDGTTLLGGDDKASIAAIMTMAEYLIAHPEIPHGRIALAFTPDEEVGGLAKDLDFVRFGVPVAYTLDGDHLGWYMDETFNASQAVITIKGRSVHTGTAKGIMINAAELAMEFVHALPAEQKPQYTEGREGFFHVISVHADCEYAKIELLIRDHDALRFKEREDMVLSIGSWLNRHYPGAVEVKIEEQYRSMKEVVDKVPWMITRLVKAIEACGIQPVQEAFRGGTDGSALSHRGLPCPNLSAGYENAHGRFEYVPIQSMEKNVEILLKLAEIYAGGNPCR
ncbi:MAG: peptidase T [Solobacterium sp.]|nr:peptidase T [Solobacterium sp.]